ncbi:MAG: YchJ family protein [Polyangiaceae bacterium]|nr:YchJ family protein [Polyangiaceae bacterium]
MEPGARCIGARASGALPPGAFDGTRHGRPGESPGASPGDQAVTCVCGLGETIEACCGRYLSGAERPPTAEALMRSRYAAYALGNVDYILESHDPERRDQVDRPSTERWSKEAEWLGLEVVSTEAGGADDAEGTVEFVAKYRLKRIAITHRERALFRKLDGRWYFVDGQEIAGPPVKKEGPKVGRNDPCPCGSGKKHKRCCGASAS